MRIANVVFADKIGTEMIVTEVVEQVGGTYCTGSDYDSSTFGDGGTATLRVTADCTVAYSRENLQLVTEEHCPI